MDVLFSYFVVLAVTVLFVVLVREIVCWYFKINVMVESLNKMVNHLEQIVQNLTDNNISQKETNNGPSSDELK